MHQLWGRRDAEHTEDDQGYSWLYQEELLVDAQGIISGAPDSNQGQLYLRKACYPLNYLTSDAF